MFKKLLILTLGLVFILATAVMAVEKKTATSVEVPKPVAPPSPKDACTMAHTNGTGAYFFGSFVLGHRIVSYFNPAVCPGTPTYPFQITALTLPLYDHGGYQWPVQVDVVVYDLAQPPDSCSGPGAELCRERFSCDSLTFCPPNLGTITFTTPCCVNGPFYIGIEYTDAGAGPFPSPLFDNQTPDTCVNWFYHGGYWYDWHTIWTPPTPGYPLFWVDGNTQPNACEEWPNHKMHFPQLPDSLGWDVNATAPVVLADDWTCSETGWVKDIHFWGSWRYSEVGQIVYFVLSIHNNDPGPPHSRPDSTLWEAEISPPPPVPHDPPTWQGWYDPSTGSYMQQDHQAYFRYDIILPEPQWFHQDSGTVYWLNVSAVVANPEVTQWGWKSTQNHYLDDAVWSFWGPPLNWIPMLEPPEFYQTLDLAFVITGEPEEDIPTLNEWGMIILALLLLAAGTIAVIRRRRAVTSKA